MNALHREWINDQAERVTLEAPELRPVGQVPCVPTSTGLLIGCAYRRPMPQPSADAERIQAALLAKPQPRRATREPAPLSTMAETVKRWRAAA